MGAGRNPQMQGGRNVPFQQPPVGPRHMLSHSHQGVSMIPMRNTYQMGGYQPMEHSYQGGYPYPLNQYMVGPYGLSSLNTMLPLNQSPFVNTQLPFLATLEFSDLSKLTNKPILHHPTWPPVPIKIPTNIPILEGKTGDDPSSHITTYHL